MDPKFTTQYENIEDVTTAILEATSSDELTSLQISNKRLLAKNTEVHELLISTSHELRESIVGDDDDDDEELDYE